MAKAKTKNVLFGVQKQQLKHLSTKEYLALRELSRLSKNMYNVALFNVRQYFFAEKKYLSYQNNYHLCKFNENYALLNSNSAQQILKFVDRDFQSFFALIKKAKRGSYPFQNINLPHYLKKDAYFNLIFSEFNCDGKFFQVPIPPAFRRIFGKVVIKIPPNLKGKNIKEVRILPKHNTKYFEIQYNVSDRNLKYAGEESVCYPLVVCMIIMLQGFSTKEMVKTIEEPKKTEKPKRATKTKR